MVNNFKFEVNNPTFGEQKVIDYFNSNFYSDKELLSVVKLILKVQKYSYVVIFLLLFVVFFVVKSVDLYFALMSFVVIALYLIMFRYVMVNCFLANAGTVQNANMGDRFCKRFEIQSDFEPKLLTDSCLAKYPLNYAHITQYCKMWNESFSVSVLNLHRAGSHGFGANKKAFFLEIPNLPQINSVITNFTGSIIEKIGEVEFRSSNGAVKEIDDFSMKMITYIVAHFKYFSYIQVVRTDSKLMVVFIENLFTQHNKLKGKPFVNKIILDFVRAFSIYHEMQKFFKNNRV